MPRPSPYPELDGESRVGEIIAILVVATLLSTLAVVLRCYSRAVVLRCFGLDDVVMIPAQVRQGREKTGWDDSGGGQHGR